jgi:hypothetical protein
VRTALFFTVILLAAFLFPAPVLSADDPHVEQLVEEGAGDFDSLTELETVIADLLIATIQFLQGISSLLILFGVFVGIGFLFFGGIFGSRSLRSVGVTGILTSVGAYLLIRNAPVIILAIQNMSLN